MLNEVRLCVVQIRQCMHCALNRVLNLCVVCLFISMVQHLLVLGLLQKVNTPLLFFRSHRDLKYSMLNSSEALVQWSPSVQTNSLGLRRNPLFSLRRDPTTAFKWPFGEAWWCVRHPTVVAKHEPLSTGNKAVMVVRWVQSCTTRLRLPWHQQQIKNSKCLSLHFICRSTQTVCRLRSYNAPSK